MKCFGLLFIAPAGSGKTWLIKNIMKSSPLKIAFISPLRALANEFYEEMCETTQLYSSGDEVLEGKHLVTTPEQIGIPFWEKIDEARYLFVLDEIHLFYKWGDTFRERLQLFIEDLYSREISVALLTATLEESLLERVLRDLKQNFENVFLADKGNMQIKNTPQKYLGIQKFKYNLKELAAYHYFSSEHSTLVFCRYRNEVEKMRNHFKKLIPNTLGCVGGEVNEFCEQLKNIKGKSLIFSTTCLSHGVNLPKISKVLFTYLVEEESMYLQMIARGGRKGEPFNIYSFNEKPRFTSNLRLKLEVLLGKMRMLYELRRNNFKQKFSQIKRRYMQDSLEIRDCG